MFAWLNWDGQKNLRVYLEYPSKPIHQCRTDAKRGLVQFANWHFWNCKTRLGSRYGKKSLTRQERSKQPPGQFSRCCPAIISSGVTTDTARRDTRDPGKCSKSGGGSGDD